MKKILDTFNQNLSEIIPTKPIKILNNSLRLEVLSSEHETMLHAAIQEFKGTEYMKQFQRKTLAFAITAINGEELPEFILDEKLDTQLPRYRWCEENILNNKQFKDALVQRAFRAYCVLSIEAKEKLKEVVTFENEEILDEVEEEQEDLAKKEFEEKLEANLS